MSSAAHAFAGSHLLKDGGDPQDIGTPEHAALVIWWCECGHEGAVTGAWDGLGAAEEAARAQHGKHQSDEMPSA